MSFYHVFLCSVVIDNLDLKADNVFLDD